MSLITCTDCRKPWGPDHGRTLPRGFVCQDCYAADVTRRQAAARLSVSTVPGTDLPLGVRICGGLGLLFLVAGLWFLFNPGVSLSDVASAYPGLGAAGGLAGGMEVANLQRLAFGQAFTVAGAVLLAAALRPVRG